MGIFVRKIIVFLIPVAILFAPPSAVIYLSREYYSVTDIYKTQNTKPDSIFYLAYNDSRKDYKEYLLSIKKPKTIVIGGSRVMQFRKEYFMEPNKFLNTSGAVVNVRDISEFIEKLPQDNWPKFLILGLDQDMFKSLSYFPSSSINNQGNDFWRFLRVLGVSWKKIYIDYFSGKFSMAELFRQSQNSSDIGLTALIKGDGYREDGSFKFSSAENNTRRLDNLKLGIEEKITLIRKDRSSFFYGDKILNSALNALDDALRLSKEKEIYVVGFLTPYHSPIYQEMINTDDIYKKIVFSLSSEVATIFSKYGFKFFDFSDIHKFGAKDSEFADVIHGTDKMYVHMAIYIAENDKLAKQYFNIDQLLNILNNSEGDFINVEW
ncbi:MAG: hypothetical protein Q7S34_02840 [bacterium]|nr:hypothetical protein [bacterium]